MHRIKEEIIKELHNIDADLNQRSLTKEQLDLVYKLACTYHYLDKIELKKSYLNSTS